MEFAVEHLQDDGLSFLLFIAFWSAVACNRRRLLEPLATRDKDHRHAPDDGLGRIVDTQEIDDGRT